MTDLTELEIDGQYDRGKPVVFRPEVWAAETLSVLRHNLVVVAWNQTGALDAVEQAKRAETYRAREAQRQANLAAMDARLAALPDILQPISQLHHRDGNQCMGCDYDGCESEPPEWPCRTIQTILGDTNG